MLAISSVSSESSVDDRWELSRAGLQGQGLQYVNITSRKSQTFANSGTYEAARGLVRRGRSGLLSTSHAELSARGTFPLLGAFASRLVEVARFFLPPSGGEVLSSSTSSSSSAAEERVLTSDDTSEAPLWRGALRTPLAFFLAFFFGAL